VIRLASSVCNQALRHRVDYLDLVRPSSFASTSCRIGFRCGGDYELSACCFLLRTMDSSHQSAAIKTIRLLFLASPTAAGYVVCLVGTCTECFYLRFMYEYSTFHSELRTEAPRYTFVAGFSVQEIFIFFCVKTRNLQPYREQIASQLRTQYVEDIYSNSVTLKSGSVVVQDHWKWHHLIDRYTSFYWHWRYHARYSDLQVENRQFLYPTCISRPRRG